MTYIDEADYTDDELLAKMYEAATIMGMVFDNDAALIKWMLGSAKMEREADEGGGFDGQPWDDEQERLFNRLLEMLNREGSSAV